MRSLLRFLIRNYAFLLFLLLETASLVMVFNYNNFQKAKFLTSSNFISASVYSSFTSVVKYFELAGVNEKLASENAKLRTLLDKKGTYTADSLIENKTVGDSTFKYTAAKIINNSTNRQQNYITLNRGRKHGIEPDQGILSSDGIVGVVTTVSESYSMGLSVLNPRWNVSAKLKNSGYYGSLSWDGKSYKQANLLEIPFHVNLEVGDTVVTSGYSSIFPEGLMIGTIESFTQPQGENYYTIKVRLSTDFKSISYVEVIGHLKKDQIKELEEITGDGETDL